LGYYLGEWSYRRNGLDSDTSKIRFWISPHAVTLQATLP
jgi:hypothetical protein